MKYFAQIHLKIGLVWDLQVIKMWDLMIFFRISCLPFLKRTAKALKNRTSQKGNDRIPTIHFQVL